ncbi:MULTISPECIES: hypothetical protein [unclassified Methanosarcina]|uniref:hypothetical protein n=1 Tax=unclassified Methanosarcina TaxID=2644672 RepID=UPI000B21388E|nr:MULTISPECIES: hypothetical protein [unclassified Methanosarcina]
MQKADKFRGEKTPEKPNPPLLFESLPGEAGKVHRKQPHIMWLINKNKNKNKLA